MQERKNESPFQNENLYKSAKISDMGLKYQAHLVLRIDVLPRISRKIESVGT